MQLERSGLILLLGAGLLTGCDKSSTGPSPFGPLRVVAGADAVDTVLAPLAQALVVEVRQDGQPLEGAVVRFESVRIDDQNQWGGFTALVAPPDRDSYGSFLADTTDRNGRAFALVKLGIRAGEASIVITVPDIGAVDTAHFTVKAGQPAGVATSPRDTALYVGNHYTPRSSIVDSYQNPVEGTVTYRVVGAAVTVADGVVTGAEPGRSQVIATFEDFADTSNVSVIPEMTLGAIDRGAVIVVNSDGSGYRVLAPSVSDPPPYTTDWSPSGNDLVFDHGYGTGPINAVDLDGTIRTISTPEEWGLYPEVSPDGNWVYYSRNIGAWRLYRVHLDGTGEEEVPMQTPANDVVPSLSPDGKRLVYVVVGDELMLLDLATGVSTDLHIAGHSPAWSPTGDRIAYVASNGGRLHTVSPDGSGDQVVGDPASAYDFGIDWSPDGKWLIARNSYHNVIELIDVESSAVLPLPFTNSYVGPSWKP